ncbi:unnamed protein product [Darwinula stevensoni]|uniref:Heparan sulfate 2-O-sulfotransferase pipe n=1 Tax=Darwinula stevensoni TaxID=69355 RepID=A0A7R9A5K9_9CRUS|nr:unnamed protein product [Darwinula stevensoni]CAG0894618.1 unnamed protein product [Darwinula stevensoni]
MELTHIGETTLLRSSFLLRRKWDIRVMGDRNQLTVDECRDAVSGSTSDAMQVRSLTGYLKKASLPGCFPDVFRLVSIATAFYLCLLCIQLETELKELRPSSSSSALVPVRRNVIAGEPAAQKSNGLHPLAWDIGDVRDLRPEDVNTTGRAGLELLFFNRVGKTGSEMIDLLIEYLSEDNVNNFNLVYPTKQQTRKSWLTIEKEGGIINRILKTPLPSAYITHHVSFCNFTRHDQPMPIYINMVRDPVDRVVSWYYYVRQPIYPLRRHLRWPEIFNEDTMPDGEFYRRDFETCVEMKLMECNFLQDDPEFRGDQRRQTLFFCAHGDQPCRRFNSKYSAQAAKEVVEKYYAVVGVQEAMDVSLAVFQHYIPRFFRNATAIYNDLKYKAGLADHNKSQFKTKVAADMKRSLRSNFTSEIEFYDFCRQRLFRQYYALKNVGLV